LSFGGPAGQIAVMHRMLVEERQWISDERFLHALNFCLLLPGPEAQQLATYIGWLMHGARGGLLAGGLFILPGFLAIMALSLLYVAWGATTTLSGLFFGLKAAVLSIVAAAVWRLGGRTLKTTSQKALACLAFVGIFIFDAPFPALIVGAGLIGLIGSARLSSLSASTVAKPAKGDKISGRSLQPAAICALLWLAPIAVLMKTLGPEDIYVQIALFFSKMALVTFGGAYAALAYVAQEAVERFHWLNAAEMLDGLGMAETTPGPLIMVLQFVGFLAAFRHPGALPPYLAGVIGGVLTAYVTFLPSFLLIFAGGPFVERLRGVPALTGALSGIAAAVVGVIANLAAWFAIHFLFHDHWSPSPGLELPVFDSLDPAALALSIVIAATLWRGAGLPAALLLGIGGGFFLRGLG
jgi:chromate transporter